MKNIKKRYYVIHINSGLKVSFEYSTIKEAIENFEEDLKFGLNGLKEKGTTFEQAVENGERRFNELLNSGMFWWNEQ